MPNLRLTRVEAASIGKYIVSLKSPPLNPAHVDAADIALVSDAAKRTERGKSALSSRNSVTRSGRTSAV